MEENSTPTLLLSNLFLMVLVPLAIATSK